MQKLYCYVDESGQDTEGRFFLVSVVITDRAVRDILEQQLIVIEERTGKRSSRWHATPLKRKIAYLREIAEIGELRHCIFYAVDRDTKSYIELTGRSVAAAIHMQAREPYAATILIDGFAPGEVRQVVRTLKAERIRYRKVRGVQDESSALVRLADAMAGFIRDREEGVPYTAGSYDQFIRKEFIGRIN